MKKDVLHKVAQLTVSAIVLASSQNLFAHSVFQTNTVVEGGSQYSSVYNNLVIGHGCENPQGGANLPVIGNTFAFPDQNATVWTKAGTLTLLGLDEIASIPGFTRIPSRDVWEKGGTNWGPEPSTLLTGVGSHSYQGSLPGTSTKGLIPFSMGPVVINSDSCAKSVTFEVAVIDVCKVTTLAAMTKYTANIWASGGVVPEFDAINPPGSHHYNAAAKYTVTRSTDIPSHNLANTPCGAGIDYIVKATKAQLYRDLKIPGFFPKSH
jgi:hypothetical protein